jgi:predicted RNase H-like HicB family nuclease/predicted RNA binding protein YcfA (HicA-like mRNA interferase family)
LGLKVSEMLRLLANDGGVLIATRVSHRQFTHAVKPGRVTVPASQATNSRPAPSTASGNRLVSRSEAPMRYAIVIENAGPNFSAYVPDLPGCVAAGATVEEAEREIREANEFHLEGLREDGSPIPPPSSAVRYVDIAA